MLNPEWMAIEREIANQMPHQSGAAVTIIQLCNTVDALREELRVLSVNFDAMSKARTKAEMEVMRLRAALDDADDY